MGIRQWTLEDRSHLKDSFLIIRVRSPTDREDDGEDGDGQAEDQHNPPDTLGGVDTRTPISARVKSNGLLRIGSDVNVIGRPAIGHPS
jgi:hypothetical protein